MKGITLATYASDIHEAQTAAESGIDHLILEDSKVCIRTFVNDFNSNDFSKLATIAQFVKKAFPHITLSANCDLLFHERHIERLHMFITSVKQAGITAIRIQDTGLIPLIQDLYPEADIHLNPEIGHHNSEGLRYYSNFVTQQTLSNELTDKEIQAITTHVPSNFEIQVQGPILIQYSNRRYMTGLNHKDSDDIEKLEPIVRTAQDQEYKQRHYRFLDNAHGHMMFLYFDRCLIRYIPQLVKTGCTSWLIDGRGESQTYLSTTISAYKKERDRFAEHREEYHPSKELYNAIIAIGKRPQKAGFFRANMTDQTRKAYTIEPPEGTTYCGKLLDLKKGKVVVVEPEQTISMGDQLVYTNPKKEYIPYTVSSIKTLEGEDIDTALPFTLICLKWQKGMAVKSQFFKVT